MISFRIWTSQVPGQASRIALEEMAHILMRQWFIMHLST